VTPGRQKSNLHYVPWNGNIETNIDEARASQLLVKEETPEGNKMLTEQYGRMEEAGVKGLRYALEAKGGVIVYCDNPQEAYDAVYGGMGKSEKAELKSIIVPYKPAFENSIQLNSVFGGVAQNDNGVSRAPKMHGAFDRATQAPVYSAPSVAMELAA
jgi:hypothetical protein